jgi:hypothetical protein
MKKLCKLFEVIFNIQKIHVSVNIFHEEGCKIHPLFECEGNEDLMELQIPYVILFTEKYGTNLLDSD